MNRSTSIDKFAPALLAAQRAIGGAKKGAENPHYKSKYADLATVIEACKEALNGAGIAFLQNPENDQGGVSVETILMHESGEWMSVRTWLPVVQGTPQAYGSAITYAKRYGLQSMLGIPSEDDDGELASKRPDGGARRETVDTFDAMPIDEKKFLVNIATAVIASCEAGNAEHAFAHVQSQRLDADEKTALWSLLPSAVRSALKKQEGNGAAPKLASQP